MGKVSFGELAFWLVTLRRPTPSEVRVFEAVLVALADHGFTPTAIAARLTYLSRAGRAPGRARRRPARRRLPLPRRHRGLRPLPARGARRRAGGHLPDATTPAGTRSPWRRSPRRGPPAGSCPAWATRCTRSRDPRTPVLIAHRRGGGPARPAPAAVRGDRPGAPAGARAAGCRSTAPASAAPRWPTSGLPLELLRGFALLARAAGLLGQLAEELRRPIGMDVYLAVDRNAVYVDPADG